MGQFWRGGRVSFGTAGSVRAGRPPSVHVVAALEYLRDPFDDAYDELKPYGLDDDLQVMRKALRSLRGPRRGREVGRKRRVA